MDNKRGLSELVSYVLLVVIAVGLSVLVYNYLSAYAPKDKPTCNQDISLVIQDSWCKAGSPATINITLLNKGLFKVDAAYIRFGAANRTVKCLLNSKSNEIYLTKFVGSSDTGLKPGEIFNQQYAMDPSAGSGCQAPTPGQYGIEVEPAVFNDNDLALCPNAVIVQPITCA